MQVREVVQQWCDAHNHAIEQQNSQAVRSWLKATVVILAVAILLYVGIGKIDFSRLQDPAGSRDALELGLGIVTFTFVAAAAMVNAHSSTGSHLYWGHLNQQFPIDDDLFGRLASAESVPDRIKAKIAARLRAEGKVTIGYLEELEAELVQERNLAGPGHTNILQFAPQTRT